MLTVEDSAIFSRTYHGRGAEGTLSPMMDNDVVDADAAMYRARAQFWKGKSIATQVRERIEGVHSPVVGDPWNVTPDLSMTTMFAY